MKLPCTFTVAGSDSGGGAGLQADLKTFAALGVHGTSVVTCVTAQNPKEVRGVQAVKPDFVKLQLEVLFAELPPKAVKTGMLFSAGIIEAVAEFFEDKKRVPLIVDPVMVATSGATLLKPSAIRAMKTKLLPLATLATPNVDEAELLTGLKLRSLSDLKDAARAIQETYGCNVLVKGGHLKNLKHATDVLRIGKQERVLETPFTRGVSTHGTGCTYSAAIAGYLALGCKLDYAVEMAKNHITQSIAQSNKVGRHWVLNPFWE